jgi:NSS family neurotransmitter:Na+ symporter
MYPAGTKRTVHVTWSSRSVFILAGTGAAIGFNNFWQFPSLLYGYGGGAFLAVYLFCLLLLGLPLLAAQFMIGRLGRNAPDGAFRRAAALARADRWWWVVGATAVLGGFLIFSYLSVVAGWTVAYALRSASGVLAGLTADGVSSIFTQLVKDTEKQLFWYTLFIGSVVLVSARGLRAGAEVVIRYAVPATFALLLLMLAYVIVSGDFVRAVVDALAPDFSKLSWIGVLAAASHAFFSLGLGAGAMLMYGAYLERDAPIARLAVSVALLDTFAALIAAITIYAVLYAAPVEPVAGPALLFQALPLAFDQLPFGQLCLTVFFVTLIVIAWLSGLALFEPAVMWVVERYHWSRPRAALVCGAAAWLLGSVIALSFNSWSFTFRFFEETKRFGFFDVIQIITNQALLPFTGIASAIFAGWVLRADLSRAELHLRSPCAFDAWLWLLRIVVPVILVCVMLQLSKL